MNSATHVPASSSSPLFGIRETSRARRESGNSTQHYISFPSAFENTVKGEMSSISSHMILKDPLEEPQVFVLKFLVYLYMSNACIILSFIICFYFQIYLF